MSDKFQIVAGLCALVVGLSGLVLLGLVCGWLRGVEWVCVGLHGFARVCVHWCGLVVWVCVGLRGVAWFGLAWLRGLV